MLEDNYEESSISIKNIIIKDKGTGNLIANQFNYYGEDPLKNSYEKYLEIFEDKEFLEFKYELILKLIKKDRLKDIIEKKRIDRNKFYDSIFEEVINFYNGKSELINLFENILDDGYKSIINSLSLIIIILDKYDKELQKILIKGNIDLYCNISSTTLNIIYSTEIKSRAELKETEVLARNLEVKLNKILFINNFYNIYNFNQIQINNFEEKEMKFINEDIKYRVTTGIIPNLIKPLYGDRPECGLRELIQNGCDACKERQDKEQEYLPRIDITHDKDYIIIRDNGIGMNIEIIKNHYFCVGNSSKKKNNLNLVGQFGIGSLAGFLLGDDIFLRTKRLGEECILDFKYSLNESEENIIDIVKYKDDFFESGTEIKIKLNDKLNNNCNLEEKLKLNDWYILSEMDIYLNGEKINYLNKDDYEFIEFKSEEKFTAEYIYSKNENFEINGKVIYNGIPLSENYKIKSYRNSIKKQPCLIIKDSNTIKKMNVNLQRSEFTNFGYLEIDLIESIYKKEFETILEEVPKKINKNEVIYKPYYYGKYINKIPLIFSKFGVGLDSLCIRKKLKENGINILVTIYNCENIKFDDLDDSYAYIFSNEIINKSYIGDQLSTLSKLNSIYVSKFFIETYFFKADNYTNGFKTDAIKSIYLKFDIPYNLKENVTKFWNTHNLIKYDYYDRIIEKNFCEIKNYIYLNKSLIEKIYSTNRNSIIEGDNIISYNYNYYENVYNEVFNKNYFIYNLI